VGCDPLRRNVMTPPSTRANQPSPTAPRSATAGWSNRPGLVADCTAAWSSGPQPPRTATCAGRPFTCYLPDRRARNHGPTIPDDGLATEVDDLASLQGPYRHQSVFGVQLGGIHRAGSGRRGASSGGPSSRPAAVPRPDRSGALPWPTSSVTSPPMTGRPAWLRDEGAQWVRPCCASCPTACSRADRRRHAEQNRPVRPPCARCAHLPQRVPDRGAGLGPTDRYAGVVPTCCSCAQ
jgi:hypothetical protein